MQLSLPYYSLGFTISFCKFWFEKDTLIMVRCCHFGGVYVCLGIWCVFWMYFSFIVYAHIRFNNIVIRNVACSFLLHMKYEKQRQYLTKESVANTELSLKV